MPNENLKQFCYFCHKLIGYKAIGDTKIRDKQGEAVGDVFPDNYQKPTLLVYAHYKCAPKQKIKEIV